MKKQLPIHRASPALSSLKGFTLIEMVTVLTIIIIVLAIAIPVWDALMNGTNIAAAQNQISAYIANARADAVYNRQTIGVFFFVDPKSQQTAMAEVQVQTMYQAHPANGAGPIFTNQFTPGTWVNSGGPFTWGAFTSSPNNNGPIYSLELVNSPDPNSTTANPKFIFYRDVVLLPKGVAIALPNSYYYYNQNGLWRYPQGSASPGSPTLPPMDRYVRNGCVMFGPDGTLAHIPYGIPYYEALNTSQYANAATVTPYNQLCERLGMYPVTAGLPDLASNVGPVGVSPNILNLPLYSSVGLVVYDRDVYLTQHASGTVADNSSGKPVATTIGDGAPFSDADLNYFLTGTNPVAPIVGSETTDPRVADKFLEENWIDLNGIAFLISPNTGSLIKAK